MRKPFALATLLFLCVCLPAFPDYREFTRVPVDPSIETKLRRVAEEVLREFPKLTADNLAISVVDVTNPHTIGRGDVHGDVRFYPASVIKIFFMAETFHQKKEKDEETARALREMIVVSDNDATAHVVDVISDTTAGPKLKGWRLRRFLEKRRVVNRWLQPMGYDVSAMMKAWSFGPYGRETQIVGPRPERKNRNHLTANATASLLLWIERRRAVSPEASEGMLKLMERPLDPVQKDENQIREFIGEALPAGARLWSKAGWVSYERHDAAIVQLASGRKFIIVILTRGNASDVTMIPRIAKRILAELE